MGLISRKLWRFLFLTGFTSLNPSANEFVFGDFKIHHKDWLTYSGGGGGTYRLLNLVRMVKFPIRIPSCDFQSPAL